MAENSPNPSERKRTVNVDRDLTIETVVGLREIFLEALHESDRLTVELSGVVNFDALGIQLLWSLARSAEAQASELEFVEVSQPLEEGIARSGLLIPNLVATDGTKSRSSDP